jgi:hypothetical protein
MSPIHQLNLHKLRIKELERNKVNDPDDAAFYDSIIAEEEKCIEMLCK